MFAVGPLASARASTASGQKMMFRMTVEVLQERGWRVRVFDLAERGRGAARRSSGVVSLARLAGYAWLLPRFWLAVLAARRRTLYLTTASSPAGFLRDVATIWPASLAGHRVVCHQFGGRFGVFYGAQRPAVQRLIRRTLGRAAAIVVEGDPVREQLAFLPGWREKVRTVVNGLPQQGDFPARGKTYAPGEPFRLLYLSNMIETKGYWDVLEAVRLLLSRGRPVECLFVGRFVASADDCRFAGPDPAREAFLTTLREDPLLAGPVRYEEGLYGEDKAAAFRRAHVFLLPSRYHVEGQPVSVLEAMAYGAVAVTTHWRLIPLMVEDGCTGYHVPYGNPAAIAERIERLLERPDELARMSQSSIDRFRERFSRESYARRLGAVLEAVDAAGAASPPGP